MAARELSFGEGATVEGEAVVNGELCCEVDGDGTALPVLLEEEEEEERDAVWREVEARLLDPTFCV